jgi:hypothetical protein
MVPWYNRPKEIDAVLSRQDINFIIFFLEGIRMVTENSQPIGKAFIVHGLVKAVSPEGGERILVPNSPIYAGDRIITGSDGSIAVAFNEQQEQLFLGRMTDVLVDEDIYGNIDQEGIASMVAQLEDIQAALEDENFDPSVDLPAPAAGTGVAGNGGGGRKVVIFTPDQLEVLPDSGAETIGVGLNFLDPPGGIIVEEEGIISPIIAESTSPAPTPPSTVTEEPPPPPTTTTTPTTPTSSPTPTTPTIDLPWRGGKNSS